MIPSKFIPGLVFQVTREQRAVMERRLAPFDVTLQQASVLVRLGAQAARPHELAGMLGTDNAGMTRLLDRLEAKGLVARRSHPSDRRSLTIELTEAGAGLAPRLAPVMASVGRDMLAGFTGEEAAALASMLSRLLDNLRHASPPPLAGGGGPSGPEGAVGADPAGDPGAVVQ